MMKHLMLVFLSALVAVAANAQAPAPVISKEDMQKLKLWPGRWTGTSVWSMRGKEEHATVEENIAWKVDGHVLLINGLGKNAEGKVVHEAIGVLSYNSRESKYHLNSWLRDGRSTDAWFNIVGENQFQWGFETPQGKIRYSIALTEKTWKETGEFSNDGTQWYPFMTMNLTKEGD
jgi:hypothetical protein